MNGCRRPQWGAVVEQERKSALPSAPHGAPTVKRELAGRLGAKEASPVPEQSAG